MITGKENILKHFDASGKTYWFIYKFGKDANAESYVIHAPLDENLTVETSRIKLNEALSMLKGRYIIAFCEKPGRQPKNDWKEEIELTGEQSAAQPAFVGAMPGMIGAEEVEQRISAALKQYQQEQELKELKAKVIQLERENRELMKDAEGPFNKISGILAPFLPKLLGISEMPPVQTAQVAGLNAYDQSTVKNTNMPNQEETISFTADQEERLGKVISVFMQHDPQWLETLEKMAAKVTANPGVLNSIKMFL